MRAAVRRLCVPLAGAALALSVIALPAAAGGPTSVLLVNPGTGRTASLYTDEADYQLLADIVGAGSLESDAQGAASPAAIGVSHAGASSVTVTWLIHDVQVWRVDRIQLDAEGGPWVATHMAGDSGNIWDSPEVWHVVARGKELAVLLDRLGVSADAPATAPAAAPAPVVAPAQVAAASAAAQAAPAGAQKPAGVGDGGSGAGLYLAGLGGLLTGAALVLVPQRYRQRRWALDSATPTSEDPSELEYEPLDPRSP